MSNGPGFKFSFYVSLLQPFLVSDVSVYVMPIPGVFPPLFRSAPYNRHYCACPQKEGGAQGEYYFAQ
jgi:hypothetical protein